MKHKIARHGTTFKANEKRRNLEYAETRRLPCVFVGNRCVEKKHFDQTSPNSPRTGINVPIRAITETVVVLYKEACFGDGRGGRFTGRVGGRYSRGGDTRRGGEGKKECH